MQNSLHLITKNAILFSLNRKPQTLLSGLDFTSCQAEELSRINPKAFLFFPLMLTKALLQKKNNLPDYKGKTNNNY